MVINILKDILTSKIMTCWRLPNSLAKIVITKHLSDDMAWKGCRSYKLAEPKSCHLLPQAL